MNPYLHHLRFFATKAVRRPLRGLAGGALLAALGAGLAGTGNYAQPGQLALTYLFSLWSLNLMAEPDGLARPLAALPTLPLETRRRALAEATGVLLAWAAWGFLLLLGLGALLVAANLEAELHTVVGGSPLFLGLAVAALLPGLTLMRLDVHARSGEFSATWRRLTSALRVSVADEPVQGPWHLRTWPLFRFGLIPLLVGLLVVGGLARGLHGGGTLGFVFLSFVSLFALTKALNPLVCDLRTTQPGSTPWGGGGSSAWSALPVTPVSVRTAAFTQAGLGLLLLWTCIGLLAVPGVRELAGISFETSLGLGAAYTFPTVLMPALHYGDEPRRRQAIVLLVVAPIALGLGVLLAGFSDGALGYATAAGIVAVPAVLALRLVREMLSPFPDEVAGPTARAARIE